MVTLPNPPPSSFGFVQVDDGTAAARSHAAEGFDKACKAIRVQLDAVVDELEALAQEKEEAVKSSVTFRASYNEMADRWQKAQQRVDELERDPAFFDGATINVMAFGVWVQRDGKEVIAAMTVEEHAAKEVAKLWATARVAPLRQPPVKP